MADHTTSHTLCTCSRGHTQVMVESAKASSFSVPDRSKLISIHTRFGVHPPRHSRERKGTKKKTLSGITHHFSPSPSLPPPHQCQCQTDRPTIPSVQCPFGCEITVLFIVGMWYPCTNAAETPLLLTFSCFFGPSPFSSLSCANGISPRLPVEQTASRCKRIDKKKNKQHRENKVLASYHASPPLVAVVLSSKLRRAKRQRLVRS